MLSAWFVYYQENIEGPFKLDELEHGIKSSRWPPHSLVWSKGQKDWAPIKVWLEHLPNIREKIKTLQNPPWYFRHGPTLKGPFDQRQFISELKNHGQLQQAEVWSPEFNGWKSPFQILELATPLNFRMRALPRAPLHGRFRSEIPGRVQEFEIDTVSEEGISFRAESEGLAGNPFNFTILAFGLPHSISGLGQVLFTRNQKTAVKFLKISDEDQKMLKDHAVQFSEHSRANS